MNVWLFILVTVVFGATCGLATQNQPNAAFLFDPLVKQVFVFYSASREPTGYTAATLLPRLKIFDDGHCVTLSKTVPDPTNKHDVSSSTLSLHMTDPSKVQDLARKLEIASPNLNDVYGVAYQTYPFSCVEFSTVEGGLRKVCNYTDAPLLLDEIIKEAHKICGDDLDELRVSHALVKKWPAPPSCSEPDCQIIPWTGLELVKDQGTWIDDPLLATEALYSTLDKKFVYKYSSNDELFIVSAYIQGLSVIRPKILAQHAPWALPPPQSPPKPSLYGQKSDFTSSYTLLILIVAAVVVTVAISAAVFFLKVRKDSTQANQYEEQLEKLQPIHTETII